MVLEDFNGGRIAAVSYDSREPIARTLASFAINLNGNPTFAGIVSPDARRAGRSRADARRGEPAGQAHRRHRRRREAEGAGRQRRTVDVEVLNMWCAEGLRAVKLPDVQQLQVRQPGDRERVPPRAGRAGAVATTSQKKAVSLHFAGDGKRKVQVGYVIEAPIWKTSYRLVLGEKEKPYLQGWAMVENPTDEDWAGVKMALIIGRPISFKMDLYNPLYVNRPTVEPELFASLRPVTYRGGFGERRRSGAQRLDETRGSSDDSQAERMRARSAVRRRSGGEQAAQPAVRRRRPDAMHLAERHDPTTPTARTRKDVGRELAPATRHRQRRQRGDGRRTGRLLPVHDRPPGDRSPARRARCCPSWARTSRARRSPSTTSSSRPSTRCSACKFKNTSGAHLNQGPITVFEGSVYAGDTRVLDVQPNEERLVSYAIDLGTEVDPQVGPGTQKITSVKAVKGIVTTVTKVTEEKKYRIINRSQTDRTLLIEHPNRTNQQFKLVDTDKPMEDTPEVYRFQTPVKAGETKTFTVKEEKDISSVACS